MEHVSQTPRLFITFGCSVIFLDKMYISVYILYDLKNHNNEVVLFHYSSEIHISTKCQHMQYSDGINVSWGGDCNASPMHVWHSVLHLTDTQEEKCCKHKIYDTCFMYQHLLCQNLDLYVCTLYLYMGVYITSK